MCTAFTYNKNGFYFGRNMDIEYTFGERIVITPRKYPWKWKKADSTFGKFALIGMANVTDGYPLYAEASNEKGLCMASLNYPGNAKYYPPKENSVNIAPYEFIPYLLSQFESVDEAVPILKKINLINIEFKDNMPLAPLHYILADKNRSVVIEQNDCGFNIYENKFGVLTNNPSFPGHIVNLQNYMTLQVKNPSLSFSDDLIPAAYGQGLGMFGLPGDVSPMSRFVRTVFYKNASTNVKEKTNSIVDVFRILDSVSMVRGSVVTNENLNDITLYSCCIDADNGIYYVKTYNNLQICEIKMFNENLDTKDIIEYSLPNEMKFVEMN